MRLENKVAVITGSGRGIGRETAFAMAKEGAKMVINDIDLEPAQEVVKEIKKRGGQAVVCCESVASMQGGEKIIQSAIDNFGRIDILINNAGIIIPAELKDITEEIWDKVIAVQLKGPFACTKAAVKHMIAQKSGRIINITSAAGRKGVVKTSPYAAAKEGMVGLTRVWARELGPYGITVNCISPSAVTTLVTGIDPTVWDMEKWMEDYTAQRALKRTSMPGEIERDIGPAFVFLASDEAGYITGEIIHVDGGAI